MGKDAEYSKDARPDPERRGSIPEGVVTLGWVSFLSDVASDMIYPLLPDFLTRHARRRARRPRPDRGRRGDPPRRSRRSLRAGGPTGCAAASASSCSATRSPPLARPLVGARAELAAGPRDPVHRSRSERESARRRATRCSPRSRPVREPRPRLRPAARDGQRGRVRRSARRGALLLRFVLPRSAPSSCWRSSRGSSPR